MNSEVLNSWKEIAAYMGRGVRTVQRWEQELGLPVRRPRGKDRSAVIALKADLDQWLQRVPVHTIAQPELHFESHELRRNAELLRQRSIQLREKSLKLQVTLLESIALAEVLRKRGAARKKTANETAHGGAQATAAGANG